MICGVKICGVTRSDDALAAAELGAEYVGMVFEPASPRFVDLRTAGKIADKLGDRAKLVGVFTNQDAAFILDARRKLGLSVLQLHSDNLGDDLRELFESGAQIWKTFWLKTKTDALAAEKFRADKILVDSRLNGLLGGTGAVSNWELASYLASRRAVVLAGGITPSNARSAAEYVKPEILDVNSGVESSAGVKSRKKLKLLFKNLE